MTHDDIMATASHYSEVDHTGYVRFTEDDLINFANAIIAALNPTDAAAPAQSGEPVTWTDVVQAIRAVAAEAARRGEMYPQTRDEQDQDRKAFRRVCESIEWYATKGGAVAEKLDAWPKVAAPQPAQTERALTEVGFIVQDDLHGWHFAPTVAWAYLGKGRVLYALAAAQPASGGDRG
jgi:hypothetical protein